jgi:dihydrofolate synthase/folylpolyglutamate synthase
MQYNEAWSFLDNLQFFKIKLGLDSMTMFLDELKSPQEGMKFIHVAGTNGKGSVGVTLLTLLARAGYRVGFYTSPHLNSVRERFRINDTYISEQEFAEEATRIRDILNGRQITYFEFTTALAMLWFKRKKVDIVILEVGLGGRLDATNVIEPLVGIITNVSMDHEAYLGNTLEEVASEKGGIVKSNIPVVSGVERNDFDPTGIAVKVIEDICHQRGAPLYQHSRDFYAEEDESGTWSYWCMKRKDGCCKLREKMDNLQCSLKGGYQPKNAALALAALEILEPHGFSVDDETIRQGLLTVSWPGRLEFFCLTRDTGKPASCGKENSVQYLLDGAHNPAGVQSLQQALADEFQFEKLILIWGAMVDKDLDATLPKVAPLADTIILTKQQSDRSAAPEELLEYVPEEFRKKILNLPDVKAALGKAAEMAGPEDLVCIGGSLYLIGEARGILLGDAI